MEVVAPSEAAIEVMRAISLAGFTYSQTNAICDAAAWQLETNEPGLGYVQYRMPLSDAPEAWRLFSVYIAGGEKPPFAFLPLYCFEDYDNTREPFDQAFRSLSQHLVGILGVESRSSVYTYSHRATWPYSFTGWSLPDATVLIVQDEFDIQFGMDVTLWVLPAGTAVDAPIRIS